MTAPQTSDFIFIDDLIGATLKATKVVGVGGGFFQIASNRESTVNELADFLIPASKDSCISQVRAFYAAERRGGR